MAASSDKPSSVAYSYAQQPAAAAAGQQQQGAAGGAGSHVNYPSMPGALQQQQGAFYPSSAAHPGPLPPQPNYNNTFAVGTPAYYVDPSSQQQSSVDSCVVGPQLWLFIFGWLLAPFFFVGAMLPACVPLKPGERGLWIANLVMSIVSFTLAIIIATTVPIMKYGMHGDSTTYVYRG